MKVAIIGGGAAGLMAAATIVEYDPTIEVFLIERNPELGKKVIISGGGRCNVTTGLRDMKTLFTKYPRGSKFLSSAFYGFPPERVYEWFEDHGVPLKNEEDHRVFPVSDDGRDIVGAFEKMFARSEVKILLSHTAKFVEKTDEGFVVHCTNQSPLVVDKIILTTGGQAYRHTGSSGDGYAFSEALGHTVTPLAASLSSFLSRDSWIKELAGVSWDYASLRTDRRTTPDVAGPFLFTHHGITGPVVFAFSALAAYEPATPQQPMKIFINLFPDTSPEKMETEIRTACKLHAKRSVENIMSTIVPKSIAKQLCGLAQISGETHGGEINNKQFATLAQLIQNIPVNAIGRGAGDEFVTAGGVELSEVNPSTMESKITPGLFFAGEILNIDGFTGGFNLQASWATGRLAGSTVCRDNDQ